VPNSRRSELTGHRQVLAESFHSAAVGEFPLLGQNDHSAGSAQWPVWVESRPFPRLSAGVAKQ
jgi:hypothetical protein